MWADPELADKFRSKTPEHKDELATHNYWGGRRI